MTQADKFFDWAYDTRQDFKWDDHAAIVKEFCGAATVETVNRRPWAERCDHYDDLTKATFRRLCCCTTKGEAKIKSNNYEKCCVTCRCNTITKELLI